VPLDEDVLLERGHQRGVRRKKSLFLPLLTRLARERLQTDTVLLLIITSTAGDFLGIPTPMTLNDLEIEK